MSHRSKLELCAQLALEWAIRCFGVTHAYNGKVRALRFAEEAIELAQALGVEKDKLHLLIDKVYERPPGDAHQEVGGSMMTLFVLGRAISVDPEHAFEVELARVLSKDAKHFAQRNQEKIDGGLD